MPTRNYQSIGEVLVSVKTEFPDITISKIRFLESEGLIEPERTPSGYRKFYEKDVERLRSILRMQRDEYLPLKVIKERLLEQEAGPSEGAEGVEEEGVEPVEELAEPPTGLQMSIEEMASATGVDRDRIKELEAFGLVCSHGPESARYYDGDDYVVLAILKHFAEREAAFFETIVMPQLRQRNPDARRAAANSLTDLARASRKLKAALLRTNLRQHLTTA
jgi:DNA-binding transcriptional MerR regulator